MIAPELERFYIKLSFFFTVKFDLIGSIVYDYFKVFLLTALLIPMILVTVSLRYYLFLRSSFSKAYTLFINLLFSSTEILRSFANFSSLFSYLIKVSFSLFIYLIVLAFYSLKTSLILLLLLVWDCNFNFSSLMFLCSSTYWAIILFFYSNSFVSFSISSCNLAFYLLSFSILFALSSNNFWILSILLFISISFISHWLMIFCLFLYDY